MEEVEGEEALTEEHEDPVDLEDSEDAVCAACRQTTVFKTPLIAIK